MSRISSCCGAKFSDDYSLDIDGYETCYQCGERCEYKWEYVSEPEFEAEQDDYSEEEAEESKLAEEEREKKMKAEGWKRVDPPKEPD